MLALVMLMTLLPPVEGRVVRGFAGGDDPFDRGLRRAVVLSAASGEPVRAPCAGVVRFAGATPRGPAVTLGCGGRRVTLAGLRPAVRAGARVRRGARLGAAAGDVSVSVREPDGAYVAPRFAAPGVAPPPAAPVGRPAARPRERPARRVEVPDLPWPAWAGVALVAAAGVRRVASLSPDRLAHPSRPRPG